MASYITGLMAFKLSPTAHERYLLLLGHGFFLVMMVFSIVYYKERMLAFDTANYTFHLLYFEDFYTGHGRVISYLMQLLPLLAIKWGASLKTILVLYSLSFVIFYYLVFNIIVYLFRNRAAGTFLALSLCLTLRYKFYAPVGEVVLGIALAALLVGWISRDKEKFKKIPVYLDVLISYVLALSLLSSHTFVFLSVLIFMGFDIIFNHRWKDMPNWLVVLFILLCFAYGLSGVSSNEYEQMRIQRLGDAFEFLANVKEYYVWNRIRWYFETEYAFPFAVFLFSLAFLLVKKKWLSSLYILLSFVFLLIVIMVSHSYLNAPIYLMIDGYLAHLGFLWSIPILFVFLRSRRYWVALLIGVLLIFGLDRIQNKRLFFQDRMAYLQEIIDEHSDEDNRKLLANMEDFDWERLWYPWGIGLETLLMTALHHPDDAATLYYIKKEEDYRRQLEDEKLFLGPRYSPFFYDSRNLPKRWISLKDGKYRRIRLR